VVLEKSRGFGSPISLASSQIALIGDRILLTGDVRAPIEDRGTGPKYVVRLVFWINRI